MLWLFHCNFINIQYIHRCDYTGCPNKSCSQNFERPEFLIQSGPKCSKVVLKAPIWTAKLIGEPMLPLFKCYSIPFAKCISLIFCLVPFGDRNRFYTWPVPKMPPLIQFCPFYTLHKLPPANKVCVKPFFWLVVKKCVWYLFGHQK